MRRRPQEFLQCTELRRRKRRRRRNEALDLITAT